MRRLVLGTLAALLVLPAAPASGVHGGPGSKPGPFTAARQTVVVGFGSSAIDLVVPKGASLLAPAPLPNAGVVPGFAFLLADRGDDSWSAVALISRSARVAGKPVNAMQVHAPQPDHCPSRVAPTERPVPACAKLVEHTSLHGITPVVSGGVVRYPLPAGKYQLVLSGPPDRFVAAVLHFSGVRERTSFEIATRPVDASFERVRHSDLAFAHVAGTFDRALRRTGLAVLGAWHTTAGKEPGPFTYAQCVAPAQPAPEACAAVGKAGAPAGALTPMPAYGAVGGPVTETYSGQVTAQTPLLRPGAYQHSVRVTRGGRGPAAGAFVWWLQADSLR